MFRLKKIVTRKALVFVYNSLFLSHLTYCCEHWGTSSVAHTNTIVKLQKKKAIRAIYNLNYRAHTDMYFIQLKTLKFDDIVKERICLFMFSVFNAIKPKIIQDIFVRGTTERTRNYHIPRHHSKKKANFICVFGARTWNQILISVKLKKTKFQFRKEIRQFLDNIHV